LPLKIHRFARNAALAAECAARQDRFAAFVEVAYSRQDSIGLKTWESYARDAGVSHADAFSACLAESASSALVDSGIAASARLGIHATPTVMLNGWRVPDASQAELSRAIGELLAGRPPFDIGRQK
jgi:protein-disulfide isomerase